MSDLSEVYHMLADNVETWTDQWKQQGLEQGLKEGRETTRHILSRLARRRFGPEVAEQSQPLLARISDPDQLEELADQLLLSPDGDTWLTQLKRAS
ncbi:MAG: transposase [Chromatiaceae bacterium]|nr:transposase [Chromatiaceae bacterium]MCF8004636.1 transposase [Chromatiaceae bacterium]